MSEKKYIGGKLIRSFPLKNLFLSKYTFEPELWQRPWKKISNVRNIWEAVSESLRGKSMEFQSWLAREYQGH